MSSIKELKAHDTALIHKICDMGDIVIDKDRRWSIEFDDYGVQGMIDAIRREFATQAVDAIMNYNYLSESNKAHARQAIRSKLSGVPV